MDTYHVDEQATQIRNDGAWRWQNRRDERRPGAIGAGTDGASPNVLLP